MSYEPTSPVYEPTRPVMKHEPCVPEPRRSYRVTWSPAQIVALVIGLFYFVIGGVTLLRTGIRTNGNDALLHPRVVVAGFSHTPLLGLIELAFGLFCILAGAIPGASRTTMTLLGTIALGLGLIIVIQPSSFSHLFSMRASNGWLYVLTGLVLLIAGVVSPTVDSQQRVGTTHRV